MDISLSAQFRLPRNRMLLDFHRSLAATENPRLSNGESRGIRKTKGRNVEGQATWTGGNDITTGAIAVLPNCFSHLPIVREQAKDQKLHRSGEEIVRPTRDTRARPAYGGLPLSVGCGKFDRAGCVRCRCRRLHRVADCGLVDLFYAVAAAP